jgi:hypothetical protein
MAEFIGSLIGVVLVIAPLWRICGRAGFNPALSLMTLIPLIGNLIVSAVLGLAEWPARRNGSA